MRHVYRSCLRLLLLVQAATITAAQQSRPAANASIEGFVFRSGSGEPLSHAQVTLRKLVDRQEQDRRSLTQADGKFSFENLEPAQYEVTAERNGYTRQVHGQRVAGGPGGVLSLAPGQAIKDVTFRLVPGGVITGRVRDSGGQPITGMQVFLMRTEYTPEGKRRLTKAEGTLTDDRGEYRLYWIPPGHYYLAATELLREKRDGLGPLVIADQNFPTTFYPSAVELRRAVAIEIHPGMEMGAVDIVLPAPAPYRIRGRVVDSSTGRPPSGVEFSLSPRLADDSLIVERNNDYTTNYDSQTGKFEVAGVTSGDYWLGAFAQASKAELFTSPTSAGQSIKDLFISWATSGASGQTSVNLTASDLNDVVLVLGPGIKIPVRLRVEGDQTPVARDLNEIEVFLRPGGSLLPEAGAGSFDANGNAISTPVVPGGYRVAVKLPESLGLYTREAVHQRTDTLNSVWQITAETTGSLDITLSSRGGQIEGVLRDKVNQPAARVQVVLVPDQPRDRLDLYKRVTADSEGRFLFRGIAPGEYKVFAWEALEEYAYYHNDVLALYETQGVPVRVQVSSKLTVEVRIIPAPNQ